MILPRRFASSGKTRPSWRMLLPGPVCSEPATPIGMQKRFSARSTYWRLTDLENTFRQLKSELGLRPIWHSTDARISAHLFIPVLAYHAVHLIRTRLRDNDINLRRDSIRNRMASWERVTTTQQTPTGQQVVVRQDARPSDEAATIARHVNVHVGAYRQRL